MNNPSAINSSAISRRAQGPVFFAAGRDSTELVEVQRVPAIHDNPSAISRSALAPVFFAAGRDSTELVEFQRVPADHRKMFWHDKRWPSAHETWRLMAMRAQKIDIHLTASISYKPKLHLPNPIFVKTHV